MKRKFYVSYVHDSYTGEKVFENARVLIDVPENMKDKFLYYSKKSYLKK